MKALALQPPLTTHERKQAWNDSLAECKCPRHMLPKRDCCTKAAIRCNERLAAYKASLTKGLAK